MGKKGVFTVNELLSDFDVYYDVHARLLDWFMEFDRKYFSSYFDDKYSWVDIAIPPDESDFWEETGTTAYCASAFGRIAFEPHLITYGLEDEVKYTLLHEMIHMFIDYVYPRGYNHGHGSKIFLEWSELLRCPIRMAKDAESGQTVTVCVNCGSTYNRRFRPKLFNNR